MQLGTPQKYKKLLTSSVEEEVETRGRSIDGALEVPEKEGRMSLRRIFHIVLATLAGLSIGVGIALYVQVTHRASTCLQLTSQPSPVTQDFAITYATQRFNGSLLKENIYRQEASPEVDAAWAVLGVDYRSFAVLVEISSQVGIGQGQIRIEAKYGGGFPADIEGFHHLHCLNLLRQALYYNYDREGAFVDSDHILQKHVSHCLDILRQQLMCTMDLSVICQVWIQPDSEASPYTFVDFNTRYVCRNFVDVRKWAEEQQLPAKVPHDFLELPKAHDRVYTANP